MKINVEQNFKMHFLRKDLKNVNQINSKNMKNSTGSCPASSYDYLQHVSKEINNKTEMNSNHEMEGIGQF